MRNLSALCIDDWHTCRSARYPDGPRWRSSAAGKTYGLSLLDAASGKVRWNFPIAGYAAHQNTVWNDSVAAYFAGKKHFTLDVATAKVTGSVSIEHGVNVRRHTAEGYKSVVESLSKSGKKAITYHTNCLVGDYHYFRAHGDYLIGRVNVKTQQVEYLQVPVQVIRHPQQPEQMLWDKALLNDARNSDGFVVCQDKRAMKDGWGHVSAASPLVVGDYLYMPTMIGIVYVLKWNAATLDENALISISDLGPAQQTWSLSSLAASEGRIYARTMKELICLVAAQADPESTDTERRGRPTKKRTPSDDYHYVRATLSPPGLRRPPGPAGFISTGC